MKSCYIAAYMRYFSLFLNMKTTKMEFLLTVAANLFT